MATRALYRRIVPAHAGVANELVDEFLALTISELAGTCVYGNAYPQAVIWYTAHVLERLPGSGAPGGQTAQEVGAVTSQSDTQAELSRSYAAPTARDPDEAELQTTSYGQRYLALRRSRKATLPFLVRA
jgi:hypothetical protein